MSFQNNKFISPPGGEDAKISKGFTCVDCHKKFIENIVRKCPSCHKNMCRSCLSYTQNDKDYNGWCNACIWFHLG